MTIDVQLLSDVARSFASAKGYSIVAFKGHGAYKATFHVTNRLGSDYALKVHGHSDAPQRQERELLAMTKCNHPNIARLISISLHEHNGAQYLLTLEDFIHGQSLTEYLQQKGAVSRSDVLSMGEYLILAVQHIASQQLVHRDIKPDNIMISSYDSSPIIVDFGIVRDLSDSTLTATWLTRGPGTPYFAAPEQLNNERDFIDWRTDQFALGVTLALVALGQHPFDHNDGVHPVDRVANRQPTSADFNRQCEMHALPVLKRMLAPWPAGRYRTASALLDAWVEQGQ